MSDGSLVVAYHGCDITLRDRLVKGLVKQLRPSANKYDWLGNGAYFFESDPERTLGGLAMSQRLKNQPMPANKTTDGSDLTVLLRQLDCAVFNYLHDMRLDQKLPAIQAVRAAFYQGAPLAETSEFRRDTHMQIALCDLSCVVGWFVPGAGTLLSESELVRADAQIAFSEAARTASKRRGRRA